MTLDMTAVGRLVLEMGGDLARTARATDERLRLALALLREHAHNVEALNKRADEGNFGGLAAEPIEPLDTRVCLPQLTAEYAIVATDGSLIEPDRHGAAYYYLMNIGSVILRYGAQAKAQLESKPKLGFRPEDLFLALGEREVPLEGAALRVKLAVAETERLAEVLLTPGTGLPVVGLQDGTLILWMPEGRGKEADFRKALLPPFLESLGRLREHNLPLASYISRPRAGDVVNTLRIACCPFPQVECRSNCPQRSSLHPAPCDQIDGIGDRQLFAGLPLALGERSALFLSRARLMEEYGEHRVCFCYLNVGSEIARIEMPEWVASSRTMLDTLHAVVFDQCRLGSGYPRALTEAHEKAVIGMGERDQCERLIEAVLGRNGQRAAPSQKQHSKQLRGI